MRAPDKFVGKKQRKGPSYLLSSHAAQTMKDRGITKVQLRKAVLNGTSRTANDSGREIIRDGNLRVVVERGEQSVKVITAMYADDLSS